MVDFVINFDDSDNSAKNAIEKIRKTYSADESEDGKDPLDIQTNPNKKYHDNIYNNEVNGRTYLSIYTGNKNAIKIGKFIKKLLPATTNEQIEDFVNELKAVQDNLKEKIEEIKEEILSLDVDTITPIEALMKLNEIKRMLTQKNK